MNITLLLIVLVIVSSFLFEVVVELLNLGHLKPKLPTKLSDMYDQKKYATSQSYLRETTIFGLVESSFSTGLILLILITGSLGKIDIWLRQFANSDISVALIFFGLTMLVLQLINLPFSVYKTFGIEAKYGFNQTSTKTFIVDQIKSLLLTLIIGLPLLAIIIWFFGAFPVWGWLYVWIFLTLFQLFMLFIAPVVILPIFNQFEPLKPGKLRSAIEAYAQKQKFQLEGIYTIDGSKRSSKANAFFTGFGKFKRIALFDTLIDKHTTKELVAILAHEIGHYKRGHIVKQLIIGTIFTGITLFIFGQFIGNPALTSALGFSQPAIYASLIGIGLLYTPISEVFGLISNYFSRKFEFEADTYAVQTYGHPQIFATALKKLATDNLTNLTPHPLKVLVAYSHPPIISRLENILSSTSR